jgi:hypothetical protein
MSDTPAAGFVMDRELQRELLMAMRAVYPVGIHNLPGTCDDPDAAMRGLSYLEERGLCRTHVLKDIRERWSIGSAIITADGLDFLEQDGGLGAILKVVTVKLHADTIRDLLAAKVDASDLPEEKKSDLRQAIGKLPGAALTAATGDLAKMGLEHAPGALHWIERLVGMIS